MPNEYYVVTGVPATRASLSSAAMRAELVLVAAGFDKHPTLAGNGSKIIAVNSGATALEAITTTGTGSGVRANSPTLVTPVLGVATATSINKVAITAPATSATLTIADGKTLTCSNTLTFTGTDASSVAFGTGGTVAYTANKLSVFAATTSAELAGVISNETGTGALVFAETPTLVTPVLGTPTSGTLTNCTGLPIDTGVSGLGTGVATALAVNTGSAGAVLLHSGAATVTTLTASASAAHVLQVEDAGTNDLVSILQIKRTTSGTAASGLGGYVNFVTENSNGTAYESAYVGVVTTDQTASQKDAALFFSTANGLNNPVERMRIDNVGAVYINDTSNANMTLGLTINQGANDDEILSLKSSDVAHGRTSLTETDTFGLAKKLSSNGGGLSLRGFADADATDARALHLLGVTITPDTTKSTAGKGVVEIVAQMSDGGTSVAASMTANGNLLSVADNGTTRFIFDAEGSAHADVEWVAFDKFDDVQMLDSLNTIMVGQQDPVKGAFGEWLSEHRDILQREKIVNFYDDGPRAMLNTTRLAMLHTGAIRQLGRELAAERESRRALEAKLAALEHKA